MGLSLLQPDVILFSCNAGVGWSRVDRGFGTGDTAVFNFQGTVTGFFLIGSGAIAELLSREELLDRFGNCLPSLYAFDDVESMSNTSSFTYNSDSNITSWLFISGSKCSTSSFIGALDPR